MRKLTAFPTDLTDLAATSLWRGEGKDEKKQRKKEMGGYKMEGGRLAPKGGLGLPLEMWFSCPPGIIDWLRACGPVQPNAPDLQLCTT